MLCTLTRSKSARAVLLALLGLPLSLGSVAWAVPGEDGDVTSDTGTGSSDFTVNTYTTLSVDVLAGANSFSVNSVTALALPPCAGGFTCNNVAPGGNGFGSALAVGDMLMIYQPQETDTGTIDGADTLAFGAVTNLGSAGFYEFVYVNSISGSTINIVTITSTPNGGATCTGLRHAYDGGASGSGRAMVIRVPQLNNLTLRGTDTPGRRIVAPAWDGTIGGVVAIEVGRRVGATVGAPDTGGLLSFIGTGTIELSGRGFRGGSVDADDQTNSLHNTGFRFRACSVGARKGEGIFGEAGITATGGVNCDTGATGLYIDRGLGRGALANAGGGGNAHNSAGGGGANGGLLTAWNGGGNPATGIDSRWTRERDTVSVTSAGGGPIVWTAAIGGVLTTSSGGGRGGYSWGEAVSDATRNPGIAGPQFVGTDCNTTSTLSWGAGSNCRANVGGVGGRPLNRGTGITGTDGSGAAGFDRLYFGGGGGAGDRNNTRAAAGAAGGGLAFVMAFQINNTGTANRISANGASGVPTAAPGSGSNDAAGGAGGGGTIVVLTNNAVPALTGLSATGGVGGNHTFETPGGTAESEGPGGGGGGGVIATRQLSGSFVSSVLGGLNGITNSSSIGTASSNPFPQNGATIGGVGSLIAGPPRNGPPFTCIVSNCITTGCFPTPVSNAWFKATRGSGVIDVAFASGAEVANVGYYIEGSLGEQRARRIGAFVAAQAGDPTAAREYRLSLPTADLDRLWLVDLDSSGRETRRGPYQIGNEYGKRPDGSGYDWSQATSEYAANLARPGDGSASHAYLRVPARGMYRISYDSLLAAGVNLAGVPVHDLALIDRDGPVPRKVHGGPVFGPGSVIEFFGEPKPNLHQSRQTYLLGASDNPSAAIDATIEAASWGGVDAQSSLARVIATIASTTRSYDINTPSDSPWFITRLTAAGQAAAT